LEGEIFYRVSQWQIFAVLLVVLLLAVEVGYRVGLRVRHRLDDHAVTQVMAIEGGVLGLLALLLAFTFSMAIERYEARRELVVKEANAIGTAALRGPLLSEPAATEVAQLFREYVDARLALFDGDVEVNRRQSALVTTDRVQVALWSRALDGVRNAGPALGPALFLSSLNDLIDVHGDRLEAENNHVPEIVLRLEFLVAIFATGLVGYGSGTGGQRNPISTTALAMLIACVLLVIVDLDRPRRGLIRVSQQPMRELQKSLVGPVLAPVVSPQAPAR
jgi:hypothetical protein